MRLRQGDARDDVTKEPRADCDESDVINEARDVTVGEEGDHTASWRRLEAEEAELEELEGEGRSLEMSEALLEEAERGFRGRRSGAGAREAGRGRASSGRITHGLYQSSGAGLMAAGGGVFELNKSFVNVIKLKNTWI